MTAREMTPERLALRRLIAVEEAASNLSRSLHELHDVCPVCEEPEGEHYADCLSGALHEALSVPEPIQGRAYPDLLAHVEAITADRDEARSEVAALRAQRDEIREAHRVEVAALAADVAEVRDDLIAVLAVLSACVVALKLPQETDGPAIVAAAQALAARLEAAERERETNAERCLEALDDIAKLLVERNAAQARADAAEAKLAALVEAWDAWKRYGNPTSPVDLDEAIRRIQGAP